MGSITFTIEYGWNLFLSIECLSSFSVVLRFFIQTFCQHSSSLNISARLEVSFRAKPEREIVGDENGSTVFRPRSPNLGTAIARRPKAGTHSFIPKSQSLFIEAPDNFIIPNRSSISRCFFVFSFQSLLQLANFYAISNSSLSSRKSDTLSDKIGLFYVVKNRLSSSDEVMFQFWEFFLQFVIRLINSKCTRRVYILICKSEWLRVILLVM